MVMTPIADVFMLDVKSLLDFKTVTRIMESGHRSGPPPRCLWVVISLFLLHFFHLPAPLPIQPYPNIL